MWVPIVLAAVTLGLFGVLRREFFESAKNPSTLTDEEFQALLDTEEGRTLKKELIANFRREGIPDAGIPELITKTLKEMLTQSWGLYSSLTDKSNLAERFDQMFVNDESIKRNGQPLAQAYAEFFKKYYVSSSDTTSSQCAPEVQSRVNEIVTEVEEGGPDQIKELSKRAGSRPPVQMTPLNILIRSTRDPVVRKMLQDYSTHMITYYRTGNPSYKTAAEKSLTAVQSHVDNIQQKVQEETARATKAVNEYDSSNQEVAKLRRQLRTIRREGPKLEDKYETQKRINDNAPVLESKYWVKMGIIAGLFAIAFVARTLVSPGSSPSYIFKSGLMVGLAVVAFVAYRVFLG